MSTNANVAQTIRQHSKRIESLAKQTKSVKSEFEAVRGVLMSIDSHAGTKFLDKWQAIFKVSNKSKRPLSARSNFSVPATQQYRVRRDDKGRPVQGRARP
jgi:hypothetical protein